MHPLDGTKLKIVRAKEQIDFLYQEIHLFFTGEPKPYEVITESNSKEPSYRVRLKKNRPPPREWGVLVGEIAYNLRSALDHLAWQLALLTTPTPSSRTEFPIFNDAIKFRDSSTGARPKIQNTPIAAQAVIESLQPYHSGDWPPVISLWWLHEINRIDKHREIIPCFAESIIKFGDMTGVYRPSKRLSNDEVIEIVTLKGTPKVEIGAEITFDIPTFDRPFPVSWLNGIHKFISEEVIPRFEVFFK